MKNGLDDIFQQSESSFDTKGGETKTKLSGRKGSSPLISLQSSQKSKSTSDQGEKKVSFSAILSVVVVGGAFYLYYSGYFNKPEISTEAAKNPTGQLIVEPAINVTGDELQALMTTNHCSDFGTLCANIKLDRANEMLVATKDKLILYVNYPAFLAQVNSSELAKAAIDLQAEYVLANFAFHPEVIAEARKKNLTYVVVVGIDPVENFVRPKYSLLIDNKSAPPFTVDDHKGYFSGIFFGGTQRMYRKKLKPLLKFSIY